MKKYSTDYYEKKYRILFDKLIIKNGFVDEVKQTRKTLGIPVENGFIEQLELVQYLLKKFTAKEQQKITMFAFMEQYDAESKTRLTESKEDKDKFFQYLQGKNRKPNDIMTMAGFLLMIIDNHNDLFTSHFIFKDNKFTAKLSQIVVDLMNKYWGFDLLDEHIAVNFIEKYLFLGECGINEYIKNKLACPHCRYIGIDHFSPNRLNMQGKNAGMFSGKYLFNKATVKMLSNHFNSVFLLIKPYANKEQVIQYIEDNWNDLKEHLIEKNIFYKQFGVNPSKIKESDFEKSKLVYSLYKLPKKELLKDYQSPDSNLPPPTYKESIISSILEKKHNIKMSADAVKKTATRFAKSIAIKKEPKDIRDIIGDI